MARFEPVMFSTQMFGLAVQDYHNNIVVVGVRLCINLEMVRGWRFLLLTDQAIFQLLLNNILGCSIQVC